MSLFNFIYMGRLTRSLGASVRLINTLELPIENVKMSFFFIQQHFYGSPRRKNKS